MMQKEPFSAPFCAIIRYEIDVILKEIIKSIGFRFDRKPMFKKITCRRSEPFSAWQSGGGSSPWEKPTHPESKEVHSQ